MLLPSLKYTGCYPKHMMRHAKREFGWDALIRHFVTATRATIMFLVFAKSAKTPRSAFKLTNRMSFLITHNNSLNA